MKYKTGDIVRVRKDLHRNAYGIAERYLKNYRGKVFVVKSIIDGSDSNNVELENCKPGDLHIHWVWPSTALEKLDTKAAKILFGSKND